MKKIHEDILQFFQNQGCVIVSTIDRNGFPHNACKGIIKITGSGRIYLFDLYRAKTLENLQANPHMSITAMDEHTFVGYCLKGKAYPVTETKMSASLIKFWEDRITSRLTRRLIRNIREEKGHRGHPEVLLPQPKYIISMEVEEVVDLTPHQLK